MNEEEIADAIEVQMTQGLASNGGNISYTTATFKRGKRRWRAGRFVRVFDPANGALKSEELRLGTWTVNGSRTLVSSEPNFTYRCEGAEIELLRHFLTASLPEGKYRLVADAEFDVDRLVEALQGLDEESVASIVEKLAAVNGFAQGVAQLDIASTLATSVEVARRRDGLAALARAVDQGLNEQQLQPLVQGQSWIFGGQYIGEANRRQLTIRSTVDIPLLRGDGALHVVELKGPVIPKLVEQYRTGFVIGPEVNRAVGQVQNYLADLDENSDYIARNLKIDCRRASATVVLGDSGRTTNATREQVRETIRNYNTFQARVQVMTYDELLENADRALRLDSVAD